MTKEERFEKLYQDFYEYVFEFEVGYKEDFNKDKPRYYMDRNNFKELLEDCGREIKCQEGY